MSLPAYMISNMNNSTHFSTALERHFTQLKPQSHFIKKHCTSESICDHVTMETMMLDSCYEIFSIIIPQKSYINKHVLITHSVLDFFFQIIAQLSIQHVSQSGVFMAQD